MDYFVNNVEIIGSLYGKQNEIMALCHRNKLRGLKTYYEKKNNGISRKGIPVSFISLWNMILKYNQKVLMK